MNQSTSSHDKVPIKADHLIKVNQAMAVKDWDKELSGDENDDGDNFNDVLDGLGGLGGGDFLSEFLGCELKGWKEEKVAVNADNTMQDMDSQPITKIAFNGVYPKYEQFIIHSERQNGGIVEREVVEKAWEMKCKALYKEWKTQSEITRKAKRLALAKALSQVNGEMGDRRIDMEEFWKVKKEQYAEREIEKKRANRRAKKERFRAKAAEPGSTAPSYLSAMSSRNIDESYDDDEE
ncbi:hypothetical protein DL98DRAFT_601402 [Cadophora sp. DSE1049]|nr:hypothetical protein DL98DRAFT_601402 [Cadophora sp. DSE1049]